MVDCNQAACDIYGYSREELLKVNSAQLIPPELTFPDRPQIDQEIFQTGKYSVGSENLRKDGSHFPVQVTIKNLMVGDQKLWVVFVRDRTEYEQALKAVREREERYQIISDLSSDFSYGLKALPDGTFTLQWMAGAFEKITGYTLEEMNVPGGWNAMMLPEDAPKDASQADEILNGQPSRRELRILTKGGEIRWIRTYNYPVLLPGEEQVEIIYGMCQDITDSKRAEKLQNTLYRISEAAHSTGRLEDLYTSIHTIMGELMPVENFYIALYDETTDLITFPYFVDHYDSPPAPQKAGLGLTEYVLRIGRPILVPLEEFDELVKRGEVNLIGAPSLDWLGAPLRAGEKTIGVMVVQSYDDKMRYTPQDLEVLNFVSGQVGTAIQRKRAEEEAQHQRELLYQVVDANPNLIFVRGADRRFVLINQALASFFGSTPDAMTGRREEEFSNHPLEVEKFYRDDQEVLQTGRIKEIEEEIVTNTKGVKHYFQSKKIPLPAADGKVEHVLCVGVDITDQRYSRLELAQNAERLEALLKLNQMSYASLTEMMDFSLEEAIRLTNSSLGYLAAVNPGETTLTMLTWSRESMEECQVSDWDRTYFLKNMGLWGEPIRQRKAVITNDYQAPNPLKRGTPPGHVALTRHVGVPIFNDEGRVVLIAGLGNKEIDYTDADVQQLTLFMDSLWRALERREADEKLRASEKRFRSYFELPLIGIAFTTPQMGWLDCQRQIMRYHRVLPPGTGTAHLAGFSPRRRTGISTRKITRDFCWMKNTAVIRKKRFIRKDGRIIEVAISSTCMFRADGAVDYVVSLVQDITERKQREMEFRALENVTSALRTAQNQEQMIPVILEQVNLLFETLGTAIMMINPVSGELQYRMGSGIWADPAIEIRSLRPGVGVSWNIIKKGEPLATDDLHALKGFMLPQALPGGKTAGVGSPLVVQGQMVGIIWAVRREPFAPHEVRLMTSISGMAANALHRAALHEQTTQRMYRLNSLHKIDLAINSGHNKQHVLEVLLTETVEQLGADAADILLLDSENNLLRFAAGMGFTTRLIESSEVKVGEGHAGRAALEKKMICIPQLKVSEVIFTRQELLRQETFVSYYAAPLLVQDRVKGVLEVFQREQKDSTQKERQASMEWMEFLEMLAGQAAIAVESASLYENLQYSNMELSTAYDATITGWSHALELRDMETEGHSQRVTSMTEELGRVLGVPENEIQHLRHGALLHDIGKMGIPDSILLKPGALSPEEFETMRQHPVYAYHMLAPITFLKKALDIPYCHHEKWDGSGYPRHLKGEEIPLAARIFSVVDVWDALCSDRPYRKRWSDQQALDYIRMESGKSFDPRVVEAFLNVVSREARV